MQRSIIRKEVIPFFLMFGALILLTVITDAFLHLLDLVWIGRWLGIPGTLMILVSFMYSMRKRRIISFGKPKSFLEMHEFLTMFGALLILVHAGIHIYAILPWLALLAMLIDVASGLTGKYLLDRSRVFLTAKREHYVQQGISADEIEKRLFWDGVTIDVMKKWRDVHLPITFAFAILGVVHIISILIFWQWR